MRLCVNSKNTGGLACKGRNGRDQLKHDRALEWAHKHLTTIGESCRSIAREVLAKILGWAIEQAQQGMTLPEIKRQLALI